ncbi:hypothetical protein EDD85DRAFT_1027621 [Armillaria nabsnona]|nr:hypothetical protein EDD85DRAFT_1027621 [Armillaria nabsnona]
MDVDSPPGSPPPPYMARDTSSPSPSMPDDDLIPSRGSSPDFPDSALLSYESRPSNLLPLRITIPPTASRRSGPPAPPAAPAATVEVRGRPHKKAATAPTPDPSASTVTTAVIAPLPEPADAAVEAGVPTFDTLIQVIMPDKLVKAARGKPSKSVKIDPLPYSPFESPLMVSWPDFLVRVADTVECLSSAQLQVASFTWRWSVPANSLRSGLKNESNLTSLIKQLCASKANLTKLVVLEMQAPMQAQPKAQNSAPWAAGTPLDAALDEDEDTDDAIGPVMKKGRIDDDLETVSSSLLDRYPVGGCLPLLAWAATIRRGDVDQTWIPLASPLFKADQAIKTKHATVSPSGTDTSASGPAPPSMPSTPSSVSQLHNGMNPFMIAAAAQSMNTFFMNVPSPMPLPYGYPPFGIYGNPMTPHTPGVGGPTHFPSTPTARHSDPRSSSPPVPDTDLLDFCQWYHLDERTRERLEEMEFSPSDDATTISIAAWKDAGFKEASWNCVLTACWKYKRDHRQS